MLNIMNRFLKYVNICTTSDENSNSFPSSPFQLAFGEALAEECKEIGLKEVSVDNYGYVSAFLPSNTSKQVPSVCFIAHMDTSPDASGFNIRPIITENYDGGIIKLKNRELNPDEFPSLKNYIGDTIISSDGTTLLGADDKAGIAEIITAMEYIIKNNIIHGDIRILFTPDEEIGKGVDYLDINSLKSDFGFTIDGGELGELEYENFNASSAEITIRGKSVHPGTAKGVMQNAALIAAEFVSLMPDETPANTEGYEGFYHLSGINGGVSEAKLYYIIRDFDNEGFNARNKKIKSVTDIINSKYGNIASCEIREQYRNMREIIEKNMDIIKLAEKSMMDCGIVPKIQPIRGGTDGARLSFMGLPCPNIFAGGHNFHGPYEFIPLNSMIKACELIVKISENITNAD
ncbi:MAG: peptidase T [Candidatus Metalachnospira sp.]|jgi:tripeptide aminopeptidase